MSNYTPIQTKKQNKGFTLIELLVVIGIIGVLASVVVFSLSKTTVKAKDTKRKVEINQMGRLFSFGCQAPSGGILRGPGSG